MHDHGPSAPSVQTKRDIQAALAAAGMRPRRRFGQNFLIDGNWMRRLAQSADLQAEDVVLEVGPGTGGLTDLLAPAVSRVVLVEIDRVLATLLRDRFAACALLSLIEGDVLAGKHELHPAVAEAIGGRCSLVDGQTGALSTAVARPAVKLVANLPYNVATPLVMNLLIDYPQVRRLCFTVQAEVGERIVATPQTKAYGPLSILSQALCRIEQVGRLGPHLFWPAPAVDSIMLRMDVGALPFATRDELRGFSAFVRGVFDHRRKQFRSAVGYVVPDAVRERLCAEVDATRRPEALGLEEWLRLFEIVWSMRGATGTES